MFFVLYSALELLLALALGPVVAGLRGPATFLVTVATLVAALIAGAVLLSSLDGRTWGALGFAWTKQTPREVLTGLGVGGGGLAIAAVALLLSGALRYATDDGSAGEWITAMMSHLGIFAIAAAAEEAVFRGYGLQALVRAFGPVPAVVGTSALFALAHAQNPNVTGFALLNIFLAGLLLGAAYLRTMSLWFATAVHTGWNWAMASLFDLPVSGLAMFDAPLYEPVRSGAAWFSGGPFGPEGGIVGTLGFIGAFGLMWWLVRPCVAQEMAALRPIAMDVDGRIDVNAEELGNG